MAEEKGKVFYNVRKAHYAPITATSPKVIWGTPVPIPGTVSLDISKVGELVKFFADGIPFWTGATNSGYEGSAEFARIPEQMLTDIWGMQKAATDNVIIENVNDKQQNFALLFEVQGDAKDRRFCFYNCTASRPSISAKTTEEAIEPQPQKLDFTVSPLPDGMVKAVTAEDTDAEVFNNWFKAVYEPSPAKAAAQ